VSAGGLAFQVWHPIDMQQVQQVVSTKHDRRLSAGRDQVWVPGICSAKVASGRDSPVWVGASPEQQANRELLVVHDSLDESDVERVLESLVRAVPP